MNEMEQEFLLLQTISLDDFEDHVREQAAIRADQSGEAVRYRIDILRCYLNEFKVPGTQKPKFGQLFKLAKAVLTIVHSNAEEESLFSRVRKNMTPQRASLSLDGAPCLASLPFSLTGHKDNHAINTITQKKSPWSTTKNI